MEVMVTIRAKNFTEVRIETTRGYRWVKMHSDVVEVWFSPEDTAPHPLDYTTLVKDNPGYSFIGKVPTAAYFTLLLALAQKHDGDLEAVLEDVEALGFDVVHPSKRGEL